MRRTAIMQPYTFPYLGYFQLIHAVDTFVFYDDVNFIKGGWINRNRILVSGKEHLISIPCEKVSQNKWIKDIRVKQERKWRQKLLKTVRMAYAKAPFFNRVIPLVEQVILLEDVSISAMAARSIEVSANYLELNRDFQFSSLQYPETREEDRADRLIDITKKTGANLYVNPQGGKELYEKSYFASNGIELLFNEPHLKPYPQGTKKDSFIPGLSIIDLMMNLPPADIRENYLTDYELE
ncbi:MAG: WbqC family protein [Bacteroidetes bacterium]|nr:WbqC family protein [Bacteroidota bacterium]